MSSASRVIPALLTRAWTAPQVATDLVEEGDDVRFLRHVGAEAVDGGTQLLAGGRRGLEVIGLEIDERQHGLVRREALRHGGPEAPGRAGDDDGLALMSMVRLRVDLR